MRNVVIAIAVVVLIIIVAAAVFATTFDVNRYRGTKQANLAKTLGRDVNLGEMHFNPFPPRLAVHDISIADDANFETHRPFVQAQELDVSVKLLPLLHQSVEIGSLYLVRPAVARSRSTFTTSATLGPISAMS